MGGESQQGSLSYVLGYSVNAHCIGNPQRAYLEPISQSLQKTIEGTTRIGAFSGQRHVEKPRRAYLEPIRDSLQIPIEGLLRKLKNVGGEVTIDEKTNQKHVENSSAKLPKPSMRQPIYTLNKGAIDKKSQQNSSTPAIPKKPQRQSPINWKQHFPKPQLRKISLFNDIDATATIKF